MAEASPLAVPQPWDLVSAAYADEVVPLFEHHARRALELAAPAGSARVVDVACGPGTLAMLAARAGHPVDAIDFSPKMIELLEARIATERLDRVTPRVGDGQALPYGDASFGAGFSMFGLMFFPDRARGFAELRRVLAPGARAVVSSWQPLDRVPPLAALFESLRDAMTALFPQAPSGSREMPLTTEDVCRAEMSAAFAEVEVHASRHVQTYGSLDELWATILRTMAPIALLRKTLGERWGEVEERVFGGMRERLGSGGGELELLAWLTVGTAR